MADCQCLPKCPFFNDRMKNMPSMANVYKKNYCRGNNSECARFMVFSALGREKVPLTLFPNMIDEAKRIIARG